ncbi:MAG TPA: acyl-ACP--UDP-N-acetylglucosamine O-acyltransferase [Gemmataceae bacterium]|nr:acyl-ACP--UDP-N-acetylglucosamine O-acyltransferase [Gemmataceae bacterium]
MTVVASAQVHPTAILSSDVTIADGVRVGPYTVIEGSVAIGPDCEIGPHVHLVGPLVLGRGNRVGSGTVIGSDPQHLSYAGQPTRTEIGDFNTFREHVTVHRGSHVAGYGVTKVGDHNYFMAHAHVGHDSKVGNHCILANGVLMAGHCELQDRVFMSGCSAMHQYVRMGRLSLLTGLEGVGKDVVPFVTVKNRFEVLGVNSIGMRRAGIATADVMIVRRAFKILYRSEHMLKEAVAILESDLGSHPLVAEMVRFIRESKRGVMRPTRDRMGDDDD